MMYRKKPVEVSALHLGLDRAAWDMVALGAFFGDFKHWEPADTEIRIEGFGGTLHAKPGDWIVKGPDEGDFYPVRAAIFNATYELAPIKVALGAAFRTCSVCIGRRRYMQEGGLVTCKTCLGEGIVPV